MATITQDAQTNIGEKTIHQERVSNPPKENSFPENNINAVPTAKLFIINLIRVIRKELISNLYLYYNKTSQHCQVFSSTLFTFFRYSTPSEYH